MTSNIGSQIIQESFSEMNEANKEHVTAATRNQVFELLKKTIRTEFLNRIDEIIMFSPLEREQVRLIVGLQFKQLQKQLHDMGIDITASDEAIDWLDPMVYDPPYRPPQPHRTAHLKNLNELLH